MKATNGLDLRASGIRRKLRRNRQIKYPPLAVKTDGLGNITKRPLTKGLKCFGDPVEWLWGRFDTPRRWGDGEPEPRGCALCPVNGYCAVTAHERIETSPQLKRLHKEWDEASISLPLDQRFKHTTWASFVNACNEHTWTDSNDCALEEEAERIAEGKRERDRLQSKTKRTNRTRKPKRISAEVQHKIAEYRDARYQEIIAQTIGPKTPLWINNRTDDRRALIVDAWQARETLERENRKASASEVVKWLQRNKGLRVEKPGSFVKRVQEALRRVNTLIESGDWPIFDPSASSSSLEVNSGFHPDAVIVILEPADDPSAED